jgi:hypothetical protein
MKILLPVLLSLFLVACSTTKEVISTPVPSPREPLTLPELTPIHQQNFDLYIITTDNATEELKPIVDIIGSSVVIVMSPEAYKAMQDNSGDVRKFIEQQQAVIEAYKKYYEKEENKTKTQ